MDDDELLMDAKSSVFSPSMEDGDSPPKTISSQDPQSREDVKDVEKKACLPPYKSAISSSPPRQDFSGSVVKRTFMQKVVFLLYPNGNISICKGECSSWFTDNKQMWKKKVKKKAPPRKKAKVTKEEVY